MAGEESKGWAKGEYQGSDLEDCSRNKKAASGRLFTKFKALMPRLCYRISFFQRKI